MAGLTSPINKDRGNNMQPQLVFPENDLQYLMMSCKLSQRYCNIGSVHTVVQAFNKNKNPYVISLTKNNFLDS